MSDQMAPDQIRNRLEPRERLLWWDRAKRGLVLRKSDLFTIPFAVIWCAIVLAPVATGKSGSWSVKLWTIPFLLVGLHMLVGRFIFDAWRRARTFYGLTDRRVLIVTPRQLRSLSLEQMGEITLEESRDGTGSIAFGREPPSSEDSGSWTWTDAPTVPTLERIKDAPRVFAAIREAQNKLRSTPRP